MVRGVLDVRVLVEEGSLDAEEGSISIGVNFDTNLYRFQSWLTRLVRMLLVLSSEAHYIRELVLYWEVVSV